MTAEESIRFGFFVATFGAMIVWEVASPRRVLAEDRRRRWPANLGLAFSNLLAARLLASGAPLAAALFAAQRGVGLLHWVAAPAWTGWVATILALDFAVYLQHLMFHAVPVFWRLHRVHHADLGFDASTGLRFHPIEIALSLALKSAVVVILGATPWAVVAFEILLNASSLFNHGNVAMPDGVDRSLRWLVVTPDMHRIHHSKRVVETNSNFGFSFSLWDRLCGTYRAEPSLGQLGIEIGLIEYPEPLHFGRLLLLPFHGSAGAYPFSGARAEDAPSFVSARDLDARLTKPDAPIVVDVRSPEEYVGELGHIDGSLLIPLPELEARLAEVSPLRWKTIVPV